jgi:hypothetical protein
MQVSPRGQREEDEGGSEGRPVMGRIGVAFDLEAAHAAGGKRAEPWPDYSIPRESGQTSLGSSVTRKLGKPMSGSVADMSASHRACWCGSRPQGSLAPGEYREGFFECTSGATVTPVVSRSSLLVGPESVTRLPANPVACMSGTRCGSGGTLGRERQEASRSAPLTGGGRSRVPSGALVKA